jgi:hypothetical protein
MKALTLTQPWATLVAIGAKKIETRNWGTLYRGPLAIHAAKGYPRWARETCEEPTFRRALGPLDPAGLLRGHILATARLVDCIPTSMGMRGTANKVPGIVLPGVGFVHGDELEFGDFTDGRYAWILDGIEPLPQPVPVRGALGLWEWSA